MAGFPDLLGSKLAEATEILEELEIRYTVIETISRKKTPVYGDLRVIRQIEKDGRLFLTVCKVPDIQGNGADDDNKQED